MGKSRSQKNHPYLQCGTQVYGQEFTPPELAYFLQQFPVNVGKGS